MRALSQHNRLHLTSSSVRMEYVWLISAIMVGIALLPSSYITTMYFSSTSFTWALGRLIDCGCAIVVIYMAMKIRDLSR